MSVPRIAAIEYPFGRLLGNPHDRDGQKAILREMIKGLNEIQQPGEIKHLPFEWPEPAAETAVDSPLPPPIATYLMKHPWHLPALLSRKVPAKMS